jgi:hypothetical protein
MPSALAKHFVEVLKGSGNRISGFRGAAAPAANVLAGRHHPGATSPDSALRHLRAAVFVRGNPTIPGGEAGLGVDIHHNVRCFVTSG